MNAKTAAKTSAEEAAKAFARDTADHRMTVLHDDGLYRHLLCKKPGSSFYWFEIVTWPGGMLVNGDMESFLLTIPEPDLFPLFRGLPSVHYWAQKVRAGRTRQYSEAVYRQHVLDILAEADDDETAPEGLASAVRGSMLAPDVTCHEECARSALDEFEFGRKVKPACSCGGTADPIEPGDEYRWETVHRAGLPATSHRVTWQQVEGFRFHDTYDWDLSDYTRQFLWCCSAIPWSIARYDESRKAATETVSVAGGAL